MLPLLIPVAGWLAAKAIHAMVRERDVTWTAELQQFRVGSSGVGLILRLQLGGTDATLFDGGMVIVRPKKDGQYIRSLHPDFADPDGDVVSGTRLSMTHTAIAGSVYIPFCSLPHPNAETQFEFILIQADGSAFPVQHTEAVQLNATNFARRNAIAAICDGAIGAVRLDGPVRSIHVRTAKEAMASAWSLDSFGIRELREHLRRSTGTLIDSPWYGAERIAVDIADELSMDDRLTSVGILYKIAGADGGIGTRGDIFLQNIAMSLDVSPDAIAEIRAPFSLDIHHRTLELQVGASVAEIKKAFRRIAKACHPDVITALGAEARAEAIARFQAAKRAHDVLIGRTDIR